MDKKVTILIVDDSPTIHAAIASMLKNDPLLDFNILKSTNGAEGCKIAFKDHPDIILMDIEMPVMDGVKATRKIKSNNKINDIPIIVMSTSYIIEDAFDAGANDFIMKPFSEFELLLRLNINIKLAQKTKVLAKQNILLLEQKLETERQNNIIARQQKDLFDDMEYASHIQDAIKPSKEILNELSKDYFIINRPKNIVGGDFFWASKANGKYYFVVGDCTGHGIAGALMSMIGSAFLNEIINNVPYQSAGHILDELRKRIIDLLNQKGTLGETNNGMDIALCVFCPENRKLEFAGAYNPVYIVRENKSLEILKADRMPIGIYVKNNPFTTKETFLGENDSIYMFTDGYPDQFGGPYGNKFRYKKFRELILTCSSNKTHHKKIIEDNFNDWVKGYEQIDDILVVGLQL
ncbi:MAG: response regulator [Bacteroidales bacterium]|nr:response regulator [Bacteroidales bacterium]